MALRAPDNVDSPEEKQKLFYQILMIYDDDKVTQATRKDRLSRGGIPFMSPSYYKNIAARQKSKRENEEDMILYTSLYEHLGGDMSQFERLPKKSELREKLYNVMKQEYEATYGVSEMRHPYEIVLPIKTSMDLSIARIEDCAERANAFLHDHSVRKLHQELLLGERTPTEIYLGFDSEEELETYEQKLSELEEIICE
jgi:hypothetical protein